MKRKNKLLYRSVLFFTMAFLAAGCGKTSENDADKAENVESTVSEPEKSTGDFEESESPSTAETGLPGQMPSFTAKDLDGNTVTEEIFAEKDLTVVNIWGTFCPPCIAEMPELGEFHAGQCSDHRIDH